jgi:hypothetical protein
MSRQEITEMIGECECVSNEESAKIKKDALHQAPAEGEDNCNSQWQTALQAALAAELWRKSIQPVPLFSLEGSDDTMNLERVSAVYSALQAYKGASSQDSNAPSILLSPAADSQEGCLSADEQTVLFKWCQSSIAPQSGAALP